MDWGQGKGAFLEQTVPWLVVGSILHASGCGALVDSLRMAAFAVHCVCKCVCADVPVWMSACGMFYSYVDGCVRTWPVDSIMCPWVVVGGVTSCISMWTVAFALVLCSEACMAAHAWLRVCQAARKYGLPAPFFLLFLLRRNQEKSGETRGSYYCASGDTCVDLAAHLQASC